MIQAFIDQVTKTVINDERVMHALSVHQCMDASMDASWMQALFEQFELLQGACPVGCVVLDPQTCRVLCDA